MKLSDYKGEEALDVLADIIDPITRIVQDKELVESIKAVSNDKGAIAQLIKPAMKDHKKEIIEILAALERETPEDYAKKMTLLSLPAKLIELFNDPDIQQLF